MKNSDFYVFLLLSLIFYSMFLFSCKVFILHQWIEVELKKIIVNKLIKYYLFDKYFSFMHSLIFVKLKLIPYTEFIVISQQRR
jgi:hypothetical protein